MIEFITKNSALFTLIFSFLVTISTIVYAILTAALVKETVKMRKNQTELNIIVFVEPRPEWINLMNLKI